MFVERAVQIAAVGVFTFGIVEYLHLIIQTVVAIAKRDSHGIDLQAVVGELVNDDFPVQTVHG